MKTNKFVIRRFERLAALVKEIVDEGIPNLKESLEPAEAAGLQRDAKDFVIGLRGSISVLKKSAERKTRA